MSAKQSYDLTILNHKFTFKTENDEKQVKKVVDYVNKKMNELTKGSNVVSTTNIAILAALNMADEFFKKENQYQEKMSQWSKQISEVIEKL